MVNAAGEVYVKDDGMGVTDEDKMHIFKPFYSTKPKAKGTGMGLTISVGIVKDHDKHW